jgi:nucleotide-binding universal stress UspA family protein
MSLFKEILFPVDFSLQCQQVAPVADQLARRMKAQLRLLHVLDLASLFAREWHDYVSLNELPSMRPRAESRLAAFLLDLFPEGTTREVVEGEAGPMIADYARNHGVDLIIMPTHGHGRFRRLLLGSVTAKVLHDAECPVLTSAHQEDGTLRMTSSFQRILCAIDLSPESARLIDWTKRIAAEFNAQAQVVYVLPVSEPAGAYRGIDLTQYHTDRARELFSRLKEQNGIPWDLLLAKGPVSRGVCQTAIEQRADLIVAGRGVLREPLGRLRTSSYAIIRESPCAVLSV